jgi:selenocysteine lyase/cysteine desulfurase
LLRELAPYKLRPAPADSPDKWETGTQSFESLAGVEAAVDYIASMGEGIDRRERIVSAYENMSDHETVLTNRFLAGVEALPNVTLFGRTSAESRTATFAIDVEGVSPAAAADTLGEAGCFVWSGDYYAYEVMHRLGKAPEGLVRIGFVHYNTQEEVDRVLTEISKMS